MTKVTIYTPNSAILHPWTLVKDMFKDLAASRGLAMRMAKRDISALYRKSILGYLWAFLIPIVNTVIWLYLQASGIVKLADTGIPYPVYVFSGTILWQIFTEAFQSPIQQVAQFKSMLAKLNFPREAVILSGIYKILFNAAIKIVVLIPAIMILGVLPDWRILILPLAILSLILAGTSMGLLLSPLGTLYDDIGKGIPIMTQFLMFFSPVVFAIPTVGITAKIFQYNILTPLLVTARAWTTATENVYLSSFIWINIILLVILFIAWIIYRITMPILIERMSS